jgi:hypothetical protein
MKESLNRFTSELQTEVTQLLVKANAMQRLLNKLRPILSELEAIDSGTATPLGKVTEVDYRLNDLMVQVAEQHNTYHGVGAEYISPKHTVYVQQLENDWKQTLDLIAERRTQLKALQG